MASEKKPTATAAPAFPSAPPPPPRTLAVRHFADARASELASLHSVLSDRLGGDFRTGRRKRRRTTGHRTVRHRKRPKLNGGGSQAEHESQGEVVAPKRRPSRRARRRTELQSNPEAGFCVSGDGTRRLRTHVWHAKRFTMVKRWGFHLPLGLQGRGRASRAVLKWLKSGALVHDASYCLPVQLEGPEDSILAVLRMVLLPPPSVVFEELSCPVLYGVRYENAMLYHVGTPASQFIAPVTYMWRPSLRNNTEQFHGSDKCGNSDKSESCTSRQLWVWIHAAAAKEGFDALSSACRKQMDETGVSVSCCSLEGQISRLEVMGLNAVQVLKKILHSKSESDYPLTRCSYLKACKSTQLKKSSILDHMENFPPHSILSLVVQDPRDLPSKESNLDPNATSTHNQDMKEENIETLGTLVSDVSRDDEHILLSLWSKPESGGVFLSDSESLWGPPDRLNCPIEENLLCKEKHFRRLKHFYLDPANDGSLASEAKEGYDKSCPVLLIRHSNLGSSCTRWSVILPLSWVKTFWIPLVSTGAHAIGLRERRWIACNNKLPSFPFDFPDCKAYSSFMADEAAAFDKAAELRPPAVRPLRVPIPSPWDCIKHSIKNGPNIVGDFRTLCAQQITGQEFSASSLDILDSELPSLLEEAGPLFLGSIPRTSNTLSGYLVKNCGRQLLLFPKSAMGERSFSKLVDELRSWISRCVNLIPPDRGLCFLRVLVHAFKEGAFEEGAVVCAPVETDLSLWASRSGRPENPQIPQNFIQSYFTQQDTGNWDLKMPDDPIAQQSYRWPIGFITSGFVRGSSKPVAVAFCEARLLSLLRRQQWAHTGTERPEIFVLIRNLRSASYRRAIATVVLEDQNEDTQFM